MLQSNNFLGCFEHTSEHEELTAEPFTMVFCLFKLIRSLTVPYSKMKGAYLDQVLVVLGIAPVSLVGCGVAGAASPCNVSLS